MVIRTLAGLIAASLTSVALIAPSAAATPTDDDCPALYVLGAQGTGESAMSSQSSADSGVLGEVMRPLVTGDSHSRIQRAYVEFDPGQATGHSGDQDRQQYNQAIDTSKSTLERMATDFARRCPASQLGVVGYREGAAAGAQFAREIGGGHGAVAPDRVAGIALLSDPSRPAGAAPFPGRPGQAAPDPAPGTSGKAVRHVAALQTKEPVRGGGIAAGPAQGGFGTLTGRVADLCIPGDLTCDSTNQVPIQQVVSNIAGTAADAHGDPLRALASVTQALAFTGIKTATAVVNNDIQGDSLATLSYQPGRSISQRLAEASDPRAPLDAPGALRAVLRVGTIGLNAVMTLVRQVVTPQNIAEIAAAGLVNPVAALTVLGQKLLGAIPELVPPTTVIRLVSEAFDALTQNITDNTQMINTTTTVKYSDELDRRSSYTSDAVSTNGGAAARLVSDWFAAAANDVAATAHTPATTPTSTPGGTSETTPPASPTTRKPGIGGASGNSAPANDNITHHHFVGAVLRQATDRLAPGTTPTTNTLVTDTVRHRPPSVAAVTSG
ncbi:MAG: cutinase family protein [Mycobacterium sp.]|nr:cutinase family protein [Mycobacterium sp.]